MRVLSFPSLLQISYTCAYSTHRLDYRNLKEYDSVVIKSQEGLWRAYFHALYFNFSFSNAILILDFC